MSANNNDDKSKIDKIREDLEKKLAALERAKLTNDDVSKNIDETIEEVKDENKEKEEKSSFLDQISSIENESKSEEKIEIETNNDTEDTIFEISDEIEEINTPEETIEEEKEEVKVVPPIVSTTDNNEETTQIKKEKIIPAASISETNTNESETNTNEEEFEEEEEKSSKLNYLIFGLIGLLVIGVGYYGFSIFKDKNKLDSDKTNQKITELQNRRYQDSIKLLEAEKRLAEFESQRFIDSIAEADKLSLKIAKVDNSNAAKKAAQKAKKAKPTTTIYKNNKPIVTSSSTVNFDKVVASNDSNPTTEKTTPDNTTQTEKTSAIKEEALIKDEKDKKIVQEVKKEKKIETLNTIDKAPIYPGCEKRKTERARKTCMITKINKFVNNNFNTSVAQDLGLDSGVQKIYISFIIDRNGYANVLRTRAKYNELKKEAVRVVNKLPRMKPGIKNGKKADLVYNLPISFAIED